MSTLSAFKRFFIVVALLFTLYVLTDSTTARACSGYPHFGVSNLPEADVLVKATVIDADDAGMNSILRVEEYYKGSGNQLITVMRYAPSLQTSALVRGYDTGCLYSGTGDHYWRRGTAGYFGLLKNSDGTYNDDVNGTAHFYVTNGVATYQEGATEGYAAEFDKAKTISEKDLVAKMLEAGNRKSSVVPTVDKANRYPLMRYVRVTTKNGTHYQINPDRSVTKSLNNDFIASSSDGAHIARRADENNIEIVAAWGYDVFVEGEKRRDRFITVPGQAAEFSSDNNLVAVWDAQKLTMYFLRNGSEEDYYASNLMTPVKVATHTFAKSNSNMLPKVMWSANGSTLVWNEPNVIWHWNIFDKAAPQKFTVADPEFSLMDVSAFGRFILLEGSKELRLIDAQTGEVMMDTIHAPNELYLIKIVRTDQDDVEVEIMMEECAPPLRETCVQRWQADPTRITRLFLYQMELLGIVSCERGIDDCTLIAESWHPAIRRNHSSGGRFLNIAISDFRSIDYDVRYQKPVIQVGDYGVYFGMYADSRVNDENRRPYLDILDLTGQIDSPIATLEWGQPVFYDTYLLSSLTTAG